MYLYQVDNNTKFTPFKCKILYYIQLTGQKKLLAFEAPFGVMERVPVPAVFRQREGIKLRVPLQCSEGFLAPPPTTTRTTLHFIIHGTQLIPPLYTYLPTITNRIILVYTFNKLIRLMHSPVMSGLSYQLRAMRQSSLEDLLSSSPLLWPNREPDINGFIVFYNNFK